MISLTAWSALFAFLFLAGSVSSAQNSRENPDLPYGALQFLPQFSDYLWQDSPLVTSTDCFQKLVVEFSVNSTDSNYGYISVESFQKQGFNCTTAFAISSRESWHRFEVLTEGKTHFDIPEFKSGELTDVSKHGWMLFECAEGVKSDLEEIRATLALLAGPNMVENNVEMVSEYFQRTFQERPEDLRWNLTLDKSQIESGDYLGIRRWDGLDPMIMVGTGSLTGHTAIALWIDGELYICESTGETNYWPPPYGIIRTPFDQWIHQAVSASFDVVLLKLSPENKLLFDAQKAIDFVKSNQGYPYGYHNFIFGWIDTAFDNYPYPLSRELLIPLSLYIEEVDYATAESLWLLALNQRLETSGLGMHQILDECDLLGITLFDLMTWPEQDSWVYPDGPSMVCDVFVMAVYRAGGLFSNVSVQMTEFQPRDSYQVKLYDTHQTLPASCQDDLPFCQLIGRYVLDLPGWSTIAPYDSMFEQCGALPSDYVRTPWPC